MTCQITASGNLIRDPIAWHLAIKFQIKFYTSTSKMVFFLKVFTNNFNNIIYIKWCFNISRPSTRYNDYFYIYLYHRPCRSFQ